MVNAKAKIESLQQRMVLLGIEENDLVEKFILGSGSGGQKINKTSSCVYLHHLPSRIEIKCQRTRSREQNRLLARQELCDRLENRINLEKQALQQEIEKKRRQKRKRSKAGQEKVLEQKKRRSKIKAKRQNISNGMD